MEHTYASSFTPLLSVLSLKHWLKGVWFTPSGILAIYVQKKTGASLCRRLTRRAVTPIQKTYYNVDQMVSD